MAQKVVGIDIGSYSIKIAELVSGSSGAVLQNYSHYNLSQDPTKDIELETIDILRNFVTNFDSQNTQFIIAVPQQLISHRRVYFPFKERHNIQKTLAFDLEEEMPFNTENSIFDAKIISYQNNGAHVLASVTLKERIKKAIQLCKDSGFEPAIVSAEALAYSNLFEDWTEPPPESQNKLSHFLESDDDEDDENDEADQMKSLPPQESGALIHMGNKKTLLLVYQNKELLSARSFPWGGSNL